jgi:dolichyl-phosphate-mannose-protein mannosyltransferase
MVARLRPMAPGLSSTVVETDTPQASRIEPDPLQVVPRRADRHRRPTWRSRGFLVLLGVTALAAGLRFYHLSSPETYVFDEVYYAKDGCYDAGIPFAECELENPGEQTVTVHPPLGREIVSLGVRAFGNRPFGWRVASAVLGTLSVLLTAILAGRLFRSAVWAGVAGLLLATESLNFVQSRIAMLDIFVAAFVVAGFLFLVLDRQWIDRRTVSPERDEAAEVDEAVDPDIPGSRHAAAAPEGVAAPAPVLRPWRLAAGAAFGLAVATKWSGGAALAGAIALVIVWEWTPRRRSGERRPFLRALAAEGFGIVLLLVLVPAAVYVLSYARWFAQNGFDLAGWWNLQAGMADFSLTLSATHPYASRPWTWLLMTRPVAYYYVAGTPPGTAAEILGMGNPAIFWGSVPALLLAAVASIRRRDWRPGLIVVAFASQYLPWFLTSRTSFLFYLTPITPFMVLAIVYALKRLTDASLGSGYRAHALAPAVGVAVALSVVLFLFFFPVLTGRTISEDAWRMRMWFGCHADEGCVFNWI